MARTKINSKSKDTMSDDGSLLVSLIHGEQIRMAVTLGWLTNLSSYTITAKCVEADSRSLNWDENELPLLPQNGGQVVACPIIDSEPTDNTFEIVFPEELANNFTTPPRPERPSYAWFGLEVSDSGTGDQQLVFKPMRGLVEILYSPSEAS